MKIKKCVLFIVPILIILLVFFTFFPSKCMYNREIKEGNKIIEKIELYKEIKGEYPQNLKLLTEIYKVEIKDKYCYELKDNKYVLWFGTSLGEGWYYYSDSAEWEDYNR